MGRHDQEVRLNMSDIDIHERTVTVNGIDINLAITGRSDAPTILLLHGLYDRWQVWEPVMRDLAERYRVAAPDLRGHARSGKPGTGYAYRNYVADLVELLDDLRVPEAVVAGHSLGALVAAHLAAAAPDRVRALVLVDPPLEQNEQSREWLRLLLQAKRASEAETYRMLADLLWHLDESEWQRQTEWLRTTADGPFEALIDDIDRGAAGEILGVLGRISIPTLLIQADPLAGGACSDDAAEHALRQLRDGTRHRFADTGHSIHRERPAELAAALRTFVARYAS
jgi:pimeloyl-ACP methyl ester carboxylesterase